MGRPIVTGWCMVSGDGTAHLCQVGDAGPQSTGGVAVPPVESGQSVGLANLAERGADCSAPKLGTAPRRRGHHVIETVGRLAKRYEPSRAKGA